MQVAPETQLLLILFVLAGLAAASLAAAWRYERGKRRKAEAKLRQVLFDIAHLENLQNIEEKDIHELHEELVSRGTLSARSIFPGSSS